MKKKTENKIQIQSRQTKVFKVAILKFANGKLKTAVAKLNAAVA